MPRSAAYDDLLMEMLKDEDRALAYLNAALDEQDPRVFLVALRNVTQAHGGIGKVAQRSGLNRESLYRVLSEKGNPSMQTLAGILGVLGARLGVERIVTRRRPTGVHEALCFGTLMGNVPPILLWQSPAA